MDGIFFFYISTYDHFNVINPHVFDANFRSRLKCSRWAFASILETAYIVIFLINNPNSEMQIHHNIFFFFSFLILFVCLFFFFSMIKTIINHLKQKQYIHIQIIDDYSVLLLRLPHLYSSNKITNEKRKIRYV